jgi:hypothetical protein
VNRLAYVMVLLVCLSVVMYPFLAQNQNQTASESVERANQLVFTLNQTIFVEGDCNNDPFAGDITNIAVYSVWFLLSRQTSRTNQLVESLSPNPTWYGYTINRYAETGGHYTNEYVVTFYFSSTTTTQINIQTINTQNGATLNAFYIPSRTYQAYNVYRWILRVPYAWYNQSGTTIYAQPWSPVKQPWASGQYSLSDVFMYGNTQVSVSPTFTFSITKINDYQIQFTYSVLFLNSADTGKTIDFYGLVYNYGGGAVTQTLISASFPAFTIQQVGDGLVFVFNVYLVSS